MRLAAAVFAALLALLLSACVSQPTLQTESFGWKDHKQQLEALTVWRADGKLALRTPEQSQSASMSWRQTGVISRLQLSGPLGAAATSFYSDGQSLEIRQGSTVTQWDLQDTTWLERETGWDFPLMALPDWIKGLPAPDLDVEELLLDANSATVSKLTQDDWEIDYQSYATFEGFSLPTRMRIQRGDTIVNVIIRSWQLPTE
ncbi:MAG: lipoprotein insertase outer membrane protein LolB [Pseudomonadota bacterium]